MRSLLFSYLRVLRLVHATHQKHPNSSNSNPLLVILLTLLVDDVEESELVNTLGGGNDTEPVTELLLLEELLCPIIFISTCILIEP